MSNYTKWIQLTGKAVDMEAMEEAERLGMEFKGEPVDITCWVNASLIECVQESKDVDGIPDGSVVFLISGRGIFTEMMPETIFQALEMELSHA